MENIFKREKVEPPTITSSEVEPNVPSPSDVTSPGAAGDLSVPVPSDVGFSTTKPGTTEYRSSLGTTGGLGSDFGTTGRMGTNLEELGSDFGTTGRVGTDLDTTGGLSSGLGTSEGFRSDLGPTSTTERWSSEVSTSGVPSSSFGKTSGTVQTKPPGELQPSSLFKGTLPGADVREYNRKKEPGVTEHVKEVSFAGVQGGVMGKPDVERQQELDVHTKRIQEQVRQLQEAEKLGTRTPEELKAMRQELERSKEREKAERRRQEQLQQEMKNVEKENEAKRKQIEEQMKHMGIDYSKVEGGRVQNEMKCLVLTSFGGTKNVEVVRMPHALPGKGEVLIRARSCGLNFQDVMTRQGLMDHPPKTPFILGGEVAGDVVALGDNVIDFQVGDRVVALPEFKGWAEFVTCPASVCFKLPQDMSYHDAVAITMNGIVAYSLLFELGSLRPGKSILLHSAAGGVGQMVTQMARSVNNVTIFGIASAQKEEEIPVDHFIERGVDYVDEIRQISPKGVDIVLDCQCGDNFHKGYNLLRPMGKYILYGTQTAVTGDTRSLFGSAKAWWGIEKMSPLKLYDENKSICGFNLRHLLYFQRERGYVRDVVAKVFEMYQQGIIEPVVDARFAFEDFADAFHRLQDHANIGKILLDPTLTHDSEEAIAARAKIVTRCYECEPRLATKKEAVAAQSFDKSAGGFIETLRETFTPRDA